MSVGWMPVSGSGGEAQSTVLILESCSAASLIKVLYLALSVRIQTLDCSDTHHQNGLGAFVRVWYGAYDVSV